MRNGLKLHLRMRTRSTLTSLPSLLVLEDLRRGEVTGAGGGIA